jgi:phospholipid transport system substrate-binding protein
MPAGRYRKVEDPPSCRGLESGADGIQPCILLATTASVTAQAIDLTATPVPEPPKPSWFLGEGVSVNLGLGAAPSPAYEGSKTLKVSPLPYIDINGLLYDRVSISLTRGLAVNIIDTQNFKAGMNVSYSSGRNRNNTTASTACLISRAAVLSGFVTYDFRPFSVGLEVSNRLGPDAGTTVSLGKDYTFRPLQQLRNSVGPKVNIADRGYEQIFFVVSERERDATQPAFVPTAQDHAILVSTRTHNSGCRAKPTSARKTWKLGCHMIINITFNDTAPIFASCAALHAPTAPIPLSSFCGGQPRACLSRWLYARGRRLSLRVGLVAFILMPFLAAPASSQPPDPVQFVFAFNHDVSVQLGSTAVDPAERKRRFSALVDEGLDLDVIGERLLGWRWARATLVDRQAFRQEFCNYLIQSFAMKITGVDDGHMTVTSALQDGDTALVLTEVMTKDGTREPFAWRVVLTSAGWRLCDVVVNNVSVVSLMRSQFDSVLQDAQSDIGPLLRLLHAKSSG